MKLDGGVPHLAIPELPKITILSDFGAHCRILLVSAEISAEEPNLFISVLSSVLYLSPWNVSDFQIDCLALTSDCSVHTPYNSVHEKLLHVLTGHAGI